MASYRTVSVTAKVQPSVVSVNAAVVTNLHTSDYPVYDGEYIFTPTQETQTAPTRNTVLLSDIVINPIPSNYGLIGWNGAVLTVS